MFDIDKMEESVKLFFEAIGDDPNREGIRDTPRRVAKMYAETMNGYFLDPKNFVTEFENDGKYLGPVILKNAELYSVCEHHLQMFSGNISIAYQPGDKIIGLSKLLRIARVYAKRPQVQERLTNQVANSLQEILSPQWLVVRYEAEHYCMRVRGVRVKDSTTVTLAGHGDWPSDIFRV